MHTVRLCAVGNGDFGQAPGPLRGVPETMGKGATLQEISVIVLRFIRQHGLGGGNWVREAGIIQDAEGNVIGRAAYNGRIHAPDGTRLFQPDDADWQAARIAA